MFDPQSINGFAQGFGARFDDGTVTNDQEVITINPIGQLNAQIWAYAGGLTQRQRQRLFHS
jgi:hypothetical protein